VVETVSEPNIPVNFTRNLSPLADKNPGAQIFPLSRWRSRPQKISMLGMLVNRCLSASSQRVSEALFVGKWPQIRARAWRYFRVSDSMDQVLPENPPRWTVLMKARMSSTVRSRETSKSTPYPSRWVCSDPPTADWRFAGGGSKRRGRRGGHRSGVQVPTSNCRRQISYPNNFQLVSQNGFQRKKLLCDGLVRPYC